MTETGLKYDKDKLRFDLLVPEFIAAMADVMTFGAHKYAPNNWQLVEPFRERYLAAMLRHVNEYHRGKIFDTDSGRYHLAQIAVNAMFLFWGDVYADKNVRRLESVPEAVYPKANADVQGSSKPSHAHTTIGLGGH